MLQTRQLSAAREGHDEDGHIGTDIEGLHHRFIQIVGQVGPGQVDLIPHALAGFINAVYANSFDDISIVPTFILTPLIYLGGVFYSMDLLPEFWANVSKLNPLVYVVNAFRYGVLGVSDVSLPVAFGMIFLFTLIAFVFSMHLLNSGKRLRQ